MFNLKAKEPDRIRKEAGKTTTPEDTKEKFKRAPWFIKIINPIKIFLSETDPFKTMLIVLGFVLVLFIAIGFILPWAEVIGEVPNRIPILTLISGITIGFFYADLQNRKVREKVCETSIGGKTYLLDNTKVDIFEGGEIAYVVSYYGKPVFSKDEDNMRRWGKQMTLFIPKQVITQFDSILGRRAKAYPDCRLTSVHMKDIDQGILYIPRKLSETRLLKKLEASEDQLIVMNEMLQKFKENALMIATNMREHDSKLLKALVEDTSKLQQAFFGPEKVRNLVREMMYYRYPYRRDKYGRSQQETGGPEWAEIIPVKKDEATIESEEENL